MSATACSIAFGPAAGCVCATLPMYLTQSIPALCDRVAERTLDIANRLRFVCAHLPPEEMLALAARMAVVELKYASGADLQESFVDA
jgi:hypothetical protein